jgi:hypothetical protein
MVVANDLPTSSAKRSDAACQFSRLVEAKRVEFQAAMGQLALIDKQWSASADEDEDAIFMYLHDLAVQDGLATSTRIPMPNWASRLLHDPERVRSASQYRPPRSQQKAAQQTV